VLRLAREIHARVPHAAVALLKIKSIQFLLRYLCAPTIFETDKLERLIQCRGRGHADALRLRRRRRRRRRRCLASLAAPRGSYCLLMLLLQILQLEHLTLIQHWHRSGTVGPTEVDVRGRRARLVVLLLGTLASVELSDSVSASGRSALSLPASSASMSAVVASARRPSAIQHAHCNLRAESPRKSVIASEPTHCSGNGTRTVKALLSCAQHKRVVGRTNLLAAEPMAGIDRARFEALMMLPPCSMHHASWAREHN
jgi:hypothetical protein